MGGPFWLGAACVALIGCSFSATGGGGGGGGDGDGDGSVIGGAPCGGAIEAGDLISQWKFSRDRREADDSNIADALPSGQINTISGPSRCGDAVSFGPQDQTYILINDRDEWDQVRSLDLFARYPIGLVRASILSRDSTGSNNGNVGLALTRDVDDTTSLIALRVQRSGFSDVYRCAPAPPPDTWFHIGVNFGGDDGADLVELWIDGVLGDSTLDMNVFGGTQTCGDGADRLTIDGSPDQWFLGVSAQATDPNSTNNLQLPFTDGAVDNLRLASQRRDFSSM